MTFLNPLSVVCATETQWHTDFNGFKNGVKDLEVMMSNVMTGAFEGKKTGTGSC